MTDELDDIPAHLERRPGRSQTHKDRVHAKLAPSASHRWIECPGSIRMSEGTASKSSVYAAEGTAAHELAAKCLTTGYDATKFLGQVIDIAGGGILMPNSPLGDDNTRFDIDEEMAEGVQLYLDYVRGFVAKYPEHEIDVEQRLDMTHIHPECFGTGDTVLYAVKTEWLHVFDFKYGKGVAVDVRENPQLLTYGSGAVRRYHNRPLKGITLHVVQPRCPHPDGPIRSYDADMLELLEFEDFLAAAAKATEAPDAPLHAGEWCKFCLALPTCPKARERSMQAALAEFAPQDGAPILMNPAQLTEEQLADVLNEADFLLTWVKAVQVYAHEQAVAGKIPPGFKLVPKRASRKWKDDNEALDKLVIDFELDDAQIYKEREMRSPAQLEKTVGKKAFVAIEAALVTKVSSGTNLVPVGDPRKQIKENGLEEFNT